MPVGVSGSTRLLEAENAAGGRKMRRKMSGKLPTEFNVRVYVEAALSISIVSNGVEVKPVEADMSGHDFI